MIINKHSIAALLFLSSSVMAEVKPASTETVPVTSSATVFSRGFCKFGMQFLVASLDKTNTHNGSGGVALIQVIDMGGKPMRCEESGK